MPKKERIEALQALEQRVVECRKCPRLVRYRERVAQARRRAFRDELYWGRPSPGFGDFSAQLLIIGLAPAAHGSNRTGRMFTGDRSGDFLYECLYRAGFASQPISTNRDDGLRLSNLFITAVCRCAPPANKPLPSEIVNCRPFLAGELDGIRPRAVLALGSIALRGYLAMLKGRGQIESFSAYPFRHGAAYRLPGDLPLMFASYHPSQQNTFTGRLTRSMFLTVLRRIKRQLEKTD